ncbi:MAG: alkaline phosphatase family protein [Parcubacteria group bacterium]|nr:alkaline phosphatase family protein [Parcubacteria group bacterium]
MNKYVTIFVLLAVAVGVGLVVWQPQLLERQPQSVKLYWFIPDGMRADPNLFTVFKWAQEGKLPNIKKMMDNGTYGYSIPVFPSHTPTNFATLFTGATPLVHGIADGPMHIEGFPLAKPSAAGFSSVTKKVPPVWKLFEKLGKKVTLLSVPGSTPPELEQGITIRGRWGGWGADTQKVVYEPKEKLAERKSAGRGFRLFFLGPRLTDFVDKTDAAGWTSAPASFSDAKEATLSAHGLSVYAYIYDSTDDKVENYDHVLFSLDKSNPSGFVNLTEGQWSDWMPVQLKFQDSSFDSDVKIKLIKLWGSSNFRVTVLYNTLNRFITTPSSVAKELTENVGPMVDFADDWPPQLIYEPEDRQTFLDEAVMSLDWHRDAVPFIFKTYKPDVFIQDTYTPNQMLESRWWQREIDASRKEYDPKNAEAAWSDILKMYQGLDAIIGKALKTGGKDTLFVLSSDHGVCPLYRVVNLNNLFASRGWLKFTIDPVTGEPTIDWKNTKVIYLKMAYIYVNPDGLDGNWYRASGPRYEALRTQVINLLSVLQDSNGVKPVQNAIPWEDAPQFFELPIDRIGDIVLEGTLGYFWSEEMDDSLNIYEDPLTSGYKQSVDAKKNDCMWTPFVMMGPGVKKGGQLSAPISNIDQLPTILNLMGIDIPSYVEGKAAKEVEQ